MSSAVVVHDMVYLKGIVPGAQAGDSIAEQTRDVLEQVQALLARAGSSVERLVSVNIWLRDIADMAGMNAVYDAWVVPGQQPVRACVQAQLAQPRYRIEIQVTAVR